MIIEELDSRALTGKLAFLEARFTADGLKGHANYQRMLREAIKRGLRQENLTPEQLLARIELEGPGFNRP